MRMRSPDWYLVVALSIAARSDVFLRDEAREPARFSGQLPAKPALDPRDPTPPGAKEAPNMTVL
jgi:hypothetical protein